MKLLPVFIFSFLLNALAVKGQGADTLKRPIAVQLNVGTQGIGAAVNYGVYEKLALRLGVNAIPIKANDVFKISGFNSTSHVSADFYNIHLLADYTPFKQQPWFRLVGGFAYFLKANGNVRIIPSDDYKYGDLTLTEDQIGYVDLNVDWKGLAPYLGLGFLKTFPKRKFNINLDLGTYYLNKPEADIIGTGILTGNSSQTEQFQSNIKNYRWLPILQLNFNYKF
ncbi:MAG: hypothetical protein REI64_14710 [Pedobacter sp.]|uniref:hypothetical protein n=1 Tax=Pedobacter sp. TaxID=1411316 RepID=UPI0028088179|nr:hypothetical protein [Pedobacter sp.]MDQ8006051.1 hypothetical protein [Pedobacter sp.]